MNLNKHKKFILENYGSKSTKEIALQLGVKEKKIRKFLEYNKSRIKPNKSIPTQETKHPISSRVILLSSLLIISLIIIVYAASVNGKFLLDEPALITENSFVKSLTNLGRLFTSAQGEGSNSTFSYYRPLQIFSYAVVYNFWKLQVQPYHILNILFHIMVALCIFWLINILFNDLFLSLCTALLYAVHPVQVESVAYIPGLCDSMSASFILLTFILYIRKDSHTFWTSIPLLASFLLALMSKESSLLLPIMLLLYHYSFKKKLKVFPFVSLVSLLLLYLIFYTTVLKGSDDTEIPLAIVERIPGFLVAISSYAQILLFPVNLHMGHDNRLFPFTEPTAWLGAIIVITLVVLAWKTRKTQTLIFFAIAWFFITLMPASNFYALGFFMADHYLYLPSLGFFLLFAACIRWAYRHAALKNFAIGFLTITCAIYSVLTFKQTHYWHDPVTFFERTLRYNPASARALNNLGHLYAQEGRLTEAKDLYERAIAADPSRKETYDNLGNLYSELGDNEKAIAQYKKAIEIYPNYGKAYNNIGQIYARTGKTQEAIEMLRKAIEVSPNLAQPYCNLAYLYITLDKDDQAVELYKKALAVDPDDSNIYMYLGNTYGKMGRNEDAAAFYEKAITINPLNAPAYSNLGNVINALGDSGKAEELYKKAILVDPNFAEPYCNLGVLYSKSGRIEQAVEVYRKALEINPKLSFIRDRLSDLQQ
jgi:tetratricopeptide (TPR) repeat protein